MNLTIQPDAHPEQGHYFPSDYFSFAHAGVPAFSIGVGREFAGKPPGCGDKLADEFDEKHYRQPSDEFQESWDFTAFQQAAQFTVFCRGGTSPIKRSCRLANGRSVSSGREVRFRREDAEARRQRSEAIYNCFLCVISASQRLCVEEF